MLSCFTFDVQFKKTHTFIKIFYQYTTQKIQRILLSFNDGREIPILTTNDPTEFDKSEKNVLELCKNIDMVTEIVYSNQNLYE